MTEAVKAVLPHCFETLRLHRIEASAQPTNGRRLQCSTRPASRARALHGDISRSTDSGRTMCCSRCSPRIGQVRSSPGRDDDPDADAIDFGCCTGRGAVRLLLLLALLFTAFVSPNPALALNPIVVSPDEAKIEVTPLGDLYEGAATACRSRRRPVPTV